MKTKISFFIFWFILITSFLASAFFVHFKANGWSLNLKTLQIIKTGMITLSGNVSDAQIKLNGQLKNTSLPLKISNLSEGYYDILIEKENYQSWQRTVLVEEGKADVIENIILFLKEPKEIAVSENITAETVNKEFQDQSKNIQIANSEIYWANILVSRFSQNISGAIIYSDKHHIVFQSSDTINVVDLDGSNNHLLVRLSSNTPTRFFLRDSGRTLYYLDGDKVLAKTIR